MIGRYIGATQERTGLDGVWSSAKLGSFSSALRYLANLHTRRIVARISDLLYLESAGYLERD